MYAISLNYFLRNLFIGNERATLKLLLNIAIILFSRGCMEQSQFQAQCFEHYSTRLTFYHVL